jgi:hypothetical protein
VSGSEKIFQFTKIYAPVVCTLRNNSKVQFFCKLFSVLAKKLCDFSKHILDIFRNKLSMGVVISVSDGYVLDSPNAISASKWLS